MPEPKAWYRDTDDFKTVRLEADSKEFIPLYALKDGEVEIVRHGKWAVNGRYSVCPICAVAHDHQRGFYVKEPPYCANCGAKMDGEV